MSDIKELLRAAVREGRNSAAEARFIKAAEEIVKPSFKKLVEGSSASGTFNDMEEARLDLLGTWRQERLMKLLNPEEKSHTGFLNAAIPEAYLREGAKNVLKNFTSRITKCNFVPEDDIRKLLARKTKGSKATEFIIELLAQEFEEVSRLKKVKNGPDEYVTVRGIRLRFDSWEGSQHEEYGNDIQGLDSSVAAETSIDELLQGWMESLSDNDRIFLQGYLAHTPEELSEKEIAETILNTTYDKFREQKKRLKKKAKAYFSLDDETAA